MFQDFDMFTLKYHGNIYGNIPLGGQRVTGMKIPEIVLNGSFGVKRFGVHLQDGDGDPQYRALGWDSY